jgi:hypothetical protein
VCFKQNTHTHTTCSFLSFPFQQHFQTKSAKPFFYILWFLIVTIRHVSFSSSSYFPPSLSLTHNPNPIGQPRKSLQDVRTQTLSQSLLQFFDFQFIHPNFIKLWILMDCYATSICEFCILCESPCNYYWWIFITFVIG